MPGRWYMASVVKTEFLGSVFDGATPVNSSATGADAYVCDPGVQTCFGRTGEQVLVAALLAESWLCLAEFSCVLVTSHTASHGILF